MAQTLPIIGFHGDPLVCPGATLQSCWAGLGAGAQTIMLSVFLTKDQQLVSAPKRQLDANTLVDELTLQEFLNWDAGAHWRSTELNAEQQPTGQRGQDIPWANRQKSWMTHIAYPTIEYVLQILGRRCQLIFRLPNADYPLLKPLAQRLNTLLTRFALQDKIHWLATPDCFNKLSKLIDELPLIWDYSNTTPPTKNEHEATLVNLDHIDNINVDARTRWFFISQSEPYAPSKDKLHVLQSLHIDVGCLLTQSPMATMEQLYQKGLIISDDFKGEKINTQLWRAGISHASPNVSIQQNNGLIIELAQGGNYTGAAYVSNLRIHGQFDAEVDFSVANPQQGTTLEMAAINVNSGYTHQNLAFDVHGAPPYASCECDQNDGFRGGLNTSYTLTQFVDDGSEWGEPWSSNMYNEYTPDVGTPAIPGTTGRLRLLRNGTVFNTYYKDQYNPGWVCSSTLLVQNISDDINIRLAAKHWKKSNPEPPANRVVFSRFRLYQR